MGTIIYSIGGAGYQEYELENKKLLNLFLIIYLESFHCSEQHQVPHIYLDI